MADTAHRQMTVDEFLEWSFREEGRWEFYQGFRVQMMTGASRRHDRIVRNILFALMHRLRGGPCEPTTADIAVKTLGGTAVRRPDVTVDCGATDEQSMLAETPTVIFEVLSPTTENLTRSAKLEEYKGIASMQAVVLVAQKTAQVTLYVRAANDAWTARDIVSLAEALPLSGLGIDLPMAEIYADVAFEG